MSTDSFLEEVLRLAQDKEIPYTPSQVKKMSQEKLEQVHKEYKLRELDELNDMFADILIIKLEELLKTSTLIKEESELAKKLQNKKLFKNDIKYFIAYITPLMPFVGLIEGSATILGEILEKFADNKREDDSSHETEERTKHDQTSTESDGNNA